MPAAVAIPALIGAAGSIGGAIIGSRAAGKAATTQAESANQGLALQREMYQTTRGDLSPWVTQGQRAATALGGLMGLDSVSVPGATGTTAASTPAARPNIGRTSADGTVVGTAVPRGTSTWSSGQTAPLASVASANPQTAAQAQTASGYVRMRAPTGEVANVPSQLVQRLTAQGATILQ